MIKLDPIMFDFFKYNFFTCTLIIAFLKGIAKMTKSTTDDKIVTLISNLFSSVKKLRGR